MKFFVEMFSLHDNVEIEKCDILCIYFLQVDKRATLFVMGGQYSIKYSWNFLYTFPHQLFIIQSKSTSRKKGIVYKYLYL